MQTRDATFLFPQTVHTVQGYISLLCLTLSNYNDHIVEKITKFLEREKSLWFYAHQPPENQLLKIFFCVLFTDN